MKRHKIWFLTEPDKSAEFRSDCPRYVKDLQFYRPELSVRVGIAFGAKWRCFDCENGFHRG